MKTKILLFLFLMVSIFSNPNKSFAQDFKNIPIFDFSNPIIKLHLTSQESSLGRKVIWVSPITYLTFRKCAFTQDVDILIYRGRWNLLTAGPNSDTSPIAAYYIALFDPNFKEIAPKTLTEVFVFNNYGG